MPSSEQENSFLRIITQEQAILHKICNIYCKTKDDKKDLFQEITIQLWKAFPSYSGSSKISTWMYRVALNTAITYYRKEKQRPAMRDIEEVGEHFVDQDEIIIQDTSFSHLMKAIEQLDRIEKAIIFLYLEENNYEEIAHIVGITKTNVGVKINRIKSKLEKLLKKDPHFQS